MRKVFICETQVRPREVAVPSSKGDGTVYAVIPETLMNDAVCDCPGYQFRGTCKHLTMVNSCDYFEQNPVTSNYASGQKVGKCPKCGEQRIVYDLDPEIEPVKNVMWMNAAGQVVHKANYKELYDAIKLSENWPTIDTRRTP